jgi:hypothetical protein
MATTAISKALKDPKQRAKVEKIGLKVVEMVTRLSVG